MLNKKGPQQVAGRWHLLDHVGKVPRWVTVITVGSSP